MSNIAPPRDEIRTVKGLVITRSRKPGLLRWTSIHKPPAKEGTRLETQAQNGKSVTVTTSYCEHFDPITLFEANLAPRDELSRLEQGCQLVAFDPREPDALHDQLEAAHQAGFGDLAEAFTLAAKVKPRVPIPGMQLGTVRVSRGIQKARIGGDALRAFFKAHAGGDHGGHGHRPEAGELTEDQKFVPTMFDVATQNAVAIEADFGVVRSFFRSEGDPPGPALESACRPVNDRRRPEEVIVVTFLDTGFRQTVAYAPRLDCV